MLVREMRGAFPLGSVATEKLRKTLRCDTTRLSLCEMRLGHSWSSFVAVAVPVLIAGCFQERTVGLAITGNNMLYYEKQFNILQIMTQKRTCQRHVPFDRGNKVTESRGALQRVGPTIVQR